MLDYNDELIFLIHSRCAPAYLNIYGLIISPLNESLHQWYNSSSNERTQRIALRNLIS